jgi:hypothetical protein
MIRKPERRNGINSHTGSGNHSPLPVFLLPSSSASFAMQFIRNNTSAISSHIARLWNRWA